MSPSDRRSLGLRGERAETKVEISDNGVVVAPTVGTPGRSRGHYQNSGSVRQTPRGHDVIQQRKLCPILRQPAAREEPFLKRGSRASREQRVVQLKRLLPAAEMPYRRLERSFGRRKVGRGDNIEITQHTNMVPLTLRRRHQWSDVLPKLLLKAC